MKASSNKKFSHSWNLIFLTIEQKTSKINQGPLLGPETQYVLANYVDTKDPIYKIL